MNTKKRAVGNRVERKKEKTRQKIISISMNLFREQGFDSTSMEQIAREVDIAKGTLYNYFPVKEAILSEYIQRSFEDRRAERILQLRKLPDTRTRMIWILSELIAGVRAQKDVFEKYLVYQIQNMISLHRDAGVKSGIKLLAREIIVLGQENEEIRQDIPLDILLALFEFAFIEVAQEFYMKPESFDAQVAIEYIVDLFMNGARGGI
ncbi:TetR/AcrR family transcriptional regulator [Syntrophomonas wolfei]|jgi:AcrR family transcriptional regulator|uniref:TetR/AcrR family transcriptional regulator n=1 Tax=Syntrophomonas wolfei TaxID=863 RepID=UPI000774C2D2|nr:TetR/AcrR family transcriptional regulator [Syntrophomonas wolfei]MDD2217488.1 TetR/AcrR family transcriptional regulator [Eubacteriales bacterium]